MSKYSSLKVTGDVYGQFNALKIRIAQSKDNRFPNVTDMIKALIALGNAHYEELLSELAKESES